MTETLITFETAKLAKEKGFNNKTIRCYNAEKYLLPTYDLNNIGCEGGLDYDDFYSDHNNQPEYEKHLNTTLYSASTQSLLQKYLREVHNIEIIVHPKEHSSLGFMYVVDVFFIDQLNNISYSGVYSLYKTYELALEAGLLSALKLIK